MSFQQARWNEPIVFEMGRIHRRGFIFTTYEKEFKAVIEDPAELILGDSFRIQGPNLPSLSEVEIVRHYTRLSQMSFGTDSAPYPLGSCTMKYNPKINEVVAQSPKIRMLHPDQDESTVQGALEILYRLSKWLAKLTGTSSVSLQPSAGAHGELVGALIIRAHHKFNGDLKIKDEMIVPDSAHGTNPASAAMAGFKVIVTPTGDDGCVDIEALKTVVNERTAGLMLTNPNTLGIFEDRIGEISDIIHESNGLLYYDGANLNAILGKAVPGKMGFDIVHINLHKTFSTPHGGGGPGSGPVGVKKDLKKFLPVPHIIFDGEKYHLDYDYPYSIGKVKSYLGNFGVIVRAYTYVLSLGIEGLKRVSEIAVLNANYLAKKIDGIKGFDLPYREKKFRKHECVISCLQLKVDTGVGAREVAKRMMDFGIHPPTIYFPLIVEEALMIEPTETETLEELDMIIDVLIKI